MGIDIVKAITANDIKNGCGVVLQPKKGNIISLPNCNDTVNISDIEQKYDAKFDDPLYYKGDAGAEELLRPDYSSDFSSDFQIT